VNDFRFENPSAAADDHDPRFAAISDIVTEDPATAWPATEMSRDYATSLFDDPRSAFVSPAFRASYALVGSGSSSGQHGALTGVYLALTDGADDTSRQQWAAEILGTGFFYATSRFRIIEGFPDLRNGSRSLRPTSRMRCAPTPAHSTRSRLDQLT
jgi:hypothetical protein